MHMSEGDAADQVKGLKPCAHRLAGCAICPVRHLNRPRLKLGAGGEGRFVVMENSGTPVACSCFVLPRVATNSIAGVAINGGIP